MLHRTRPAARGALFLLSFFMLLGLGGCGGGSSSPAPADPPPTADAPDEGLAIIGLTDAPGDFLSYSVKVVSILLERPNGVVIETLPEATMVDFAQYVEATEFVTAAAVPNGVYSGMSLVLDYSDAEIIVENDAGEAVAATIVDESGGAVTQTELSVQFAQRDQFRIAPGIPAHVTLDFDLEASHKLDLTSEPATAVLDGVLIADTLLEDPKPRRARGLLTGVDTNAGEFDIAIRPFFHPRGDFGRLTVAVDSDTEYEIDGAMFVGSDGLDALAAQAVGTAVVAFGELDPASRAFNASTVLAGSSVPFGNADIASGTVIAREGDTLTLRGVTLVRENMSVIFNDTLSVVLGEETTVTQQGAGLIEIGADDISVGQRITASGALRDDETLNTSPGLVRVRYTDLSGVTVQIAPLVVDVASINRRRAGLYDFTGTGIDQANDADPDAYEIDTGTLTLSGFDIGQPTRIRGLVAPFGTAPADFYARSLAQFSAVPARLRVKWQEGGDPDAVLTLDPELIVIDLDEEFLGRIHHFLQAGIPLDLLDIGTRLSLSPVDSGRGVFSLRQDRSQQVFFDFASFVEELASRLDGTVAIVAISGNGELGEGNALSARRLMISLE